MQLKTLAAIVSVAFTLGVQAAPYPFDRAAGAKGVLKRSYYHGKDMSQVSKRAMALVAKKRDSNHHHRVGKECKSKTKTTPTTPTPQQPETTPPTPQQPETTPPAPQQPETTPDTMEPISSPAPVPTRGITKAVAVGNNNTGSGSSSLDTEAQQWLDKHNQARAQHGAAPLTWSSELATYAKNYANRCIWEHSGGPHGENLAAGSPLTPADCVNMWMGEVDDYDPDAPLFSHFTQVVWKATTELGCAMVQCPPGTLFEGSGTTLYGICEYNPPGNYDGEFDENVQK